MPHERSYFMRIRRRLPILFGVVLVVAAIALAVVLRKHAPPEPARLLPGADGYLYVNLKWIRRANIAGQMPDVPHEPEYEQFIQATGFQFERDLDQAAFAIHYPAVRKNANPAAPEPPRFSEVFVGRIEGERLRAYLGKISGSVENYRSVDIYSIPLEGRTLRVAILGFDTVAASNHDDPMVIRGIVDRSRKVASPFGGPALLRRYYKYVPLASLGWAVFQGGSGGQLAQPECPVISIYQAGHGGGVGALSGTRAFPGGGLHRQQRRCPAPDRTVGDISAALPHCGGDGFDAGQRS